MQNVRVGHYQFSFPDDLKIEIIDEKDIQGVACSDQKNKYQILDCLLGLRLLINGIDDYSCRDMPLNDGTIYFLPKFVKIEKLKWPVFAPFEIKI